MTAAETRTLAPTRSTGTTDRLGVDPDALDHIRERLGRAAHAAVESDFYGLGTVEPVAEGLWVAVEALWEAAIDMRLSGESAAQALAAHLGAAARVFRYVDEAGGAGPSSRS